MSTLKQILEKRGMLLCSGCGMQMRPQQGTCPDCGVSYGFGMGAKDAPGMSEAKTEEEPTADFKLDKIGRKIKASKIIFNKGEDDSTKKVQEDMKTTYKDFMETIYANEELKGNQHKIDKNKNGKVDKHDFKLLRKEDTTEEVEELDELSVNTLSSYGKKAGRSIDRKLDQAADHSEKATNLYDRGTASAVDKAYDHEGKSNNLHKQVNKRNASMDQAAGKLKNKMSKGVAEEVDEGEVPEHMKGKQKPYVSSNSKGDYEVLGNQGQVKATFSRKEHGNDARSMARAHVQKHYDTYLKEEDMNEELNEADTLTKLKKELDQHHKIFDFYRSVGGPPRSHPVHAQMKKVRAEIAARKANNNFGMKEEADIDEELHPAASKVLKHIKPEHHAKYTPDMTTKHYTGNFADRRAVLSAAEKAGHLKEASPFDWRNTPRQTSDKTKTSTYHDVKKISTGTVYTKQFDKDGTSKGTGDDAAKKAEGAAKRGRGRPKKDKFAESVEMLLSLSEDQFDSMMEEGFDAFFEAYEELDELSKTTLGDYAKKASREATINRKIASDFEHMSDRSRTPGMKQAAGVNAQNYKERSWKRRDGAEKAIDKLTK